MTIEERRAREAYDKVNPWRPIQEAPTGVLCELLFDDMAGHHAFEHIYYFLSDGQWYRTDPPARVYKNPMNWRPAWVKVTPEKQALIKKRATTLI